MSSLIEKDAVHLDALAAIRPAGIGRDVLQNITQVSVTIVRPYVAHSACVGVRIELLNGWQIVQIWQGIISGPAVWVDDDGVVEIRRCVQSTDVSNCIASLFIVVRTHHTKAARSCSQDRCRAAGVRTRPSLLICVVQIRLLQ